MPIPRRVVIRAADLIPAGSSIPFPAGDGDIPPVDLDSNAREVLAFDVVEDPGHVVRRAIADLYARNYTPEVAILGWRLAWSLALQLHEQGLYTHDAVRRSDVVAQLAALCGTTSRVFGVRVVVDPTDELRCVVVPVANQIYHRVADKTFPRGR